jgi:hypothetical protein
MRSKSNSGEEVYALQYYELAILEEEILVNYLMK